MNEAPSLPFAISAWDAWLPGLEDSNAVLALLNKGVDNHDSVKPAGATIPPRVRRRCGNLTRMTVDAAFKACERADLSAAEVPLVYASRHGESHVFRKLVAMLASDEAFSPMAFGNSVHHTPAGYYGMVATNRGIARALSAGPSSFDCGFIETLALSRQLANQPVLYVYADEPLLEPYLHQVATPAHPYALALVINASAAKATMTFSSHKAEQSVEMAHADEPAIHFLRWFLERNPSMSCDGLLGSWRWEP